MAAVTQDDRTPEQALKLMALVACQLRLLNRFCDRMTRLGFMPGNPLWLAAIAARDAMQDLHLASHYASFKHGVGM